MLPRLVKGAGNRASGTACLMTAAAWIAGEQWSDRPECVCPSLHRLGQIANDWLDNADRERVIGPLIFRVMGTNCGPELTQRRLWVIADTAVRVWTPIALRDAGLKAEAERLESMPEIVDTATAINAFCAAEAADAAASADAAAAAAKAAAAAAYAAKAAAKAAAKDAFHASADAAMAANATIAANAADAAATHVARHQRHAAEHLLVPLIVRLCEMGERAEVVPVRRLEDLMPQVAS